MFSELKKAYLYCYKCVYFSKTGNYVLSPTEFFFRKSFSFYKMVKKVEREQCKPNGQEVWCQGC